MFLRGTGVSPVNGQPGPALKTAQNDGQESHTHYAGSLIANAVGDHQHNINFNTIPTSFDAPNGRRPFMDVDNVDQVASFTVIRQTRPAGGHGHSISGNSAYTGTNETRPVNYGVNYIIKL